MFKQFYRSMVCLPRHKATTPGFLAAIFLLLMLGPLRGVSAGQPQPAPDDADAVKRIYWTDQQQGSQTGEIWRSNADGSSLERIVSGLKAPRGIELDYNTSRIYWVDRINDTLGRANLDGSGLSTAFCSGLTTPDDLVLDIANRKMYWTEPTANRIRWSSMDNCNPQTVSISGGVNNPIGIALANNKLYWSEFSSGRVKRANLNGTSVETLVTGLKAPLEMALDVNAGYMYIVDSAEDTPGYGGRIVRAPLNGGDFTNIVSNLDNPRGIALDLESDHLYWIDFGTQKLQRMDLSSDDIITIKSGGDHLTFPRSLALEQQSTVTCHTLTLNRTGNGSKPTADPPNSTGCQSGKYTAGTTISLSAQPDNNWKVGSWSGTDNNSSTANNNTVTMPNGARTATVNYVQQTTCYTLLLQYTGSGSKPTASPKNSSGCPNEQYVAGAAINLTAKPASNWVVEGWTGTNDDAGTALSNTVTMPAANHTVIAHYKGQVDCYTLLLKHTGEGKDPIPSPPSSTGCQIGQYKAGALISLTADPAQSWTVKSWSGTTDNSSTSTTNNAIMPGAAHTVIANYAPPACYQLLLSREGPGGIPTASPANSTGCQAGWYLPDTAIVLTASPSAGAEVVDWYGTIDNAATSQTNIVLMPAATHQAGVRYRMIPMFANRIYLPGTLRPAPVVAPTCYTGEREIEPNNGRKEAGNNGPFCFGRTYAGLPTDQWDVFAYDVDTPGTINVTVNNHQASNVLLIISDISGTTLTQDTNPADGLQLSYPLPSPGRYFVALLVPNPDTGETVNYTLRVTRD